MNSQKIDSIIGGTRLTIEQLSVLTGLTEQDVHARLLRAGVQSAPNTRGRLLYALADAWRVFTAPPATSAGLKTAMRRAAHRVQRAK